VKPSCKPRSCRHGRVPRHNQDTTDSQGQTTKHFCLPGTEPILRLTSKRAAKQSPAPHHTPQTSSWSGREGARLPLAQPNLDMVSITTSVLVAARVHHTTYSAETPISLIHGSSCPASRSQQGMHPDLLGCRSITGKTHQKHGASHTHCPRKLGALASNWTGAHLRVPPGSHTAQSRLRKPAAGRALQPPAHRAPAPPAQGPPPHASSSSCATSCCRRTR
jgi:hypothetical protein